jgi:hypothetical protein
MADGKEPQTDTEIDERFDPAFQRGFQGSGVTRSIPNRTVGSRPGYLQPAAPLAPPPSVPSAPTTRTSSTASEFAPAMPAAGSATAESEPALPAAPIGSPPPSSTVADDPAPSAPPERGRPNPIDIGLWVLSAVLIVAAYFVGTRGAEIQAHGYFVQSDAYAFVFSQVMIGTAPLLLAVGLLLAITQLVRLSISWERKHRR